MKSFETCTDSLCLPGRDGQDRVLVLPPLLAVVDGAGGVAGGHEAADACIAWFRACNLHGLRRRDAGIRLLRKVVELDDVLNRAPETGEAALAAVVLTHDGGCAVVAGDCEVWLDDGAGFRPLSEGRAGPRVGTRCATPKVVTFAPPRRLLLVTDGISKATTMRRSLRQPHLSLQRLVDDSRLPNGALGDDIAAVLVDDRGQTQPDHSDA